MNQQSCIRCYISGTVQGVFYRASAQAEARKYGITGWAKNLPDGRVEVIACGATKNLELFFLWLKQGPKNAQVHHATFEEIPWVLHQDFVVL
jgi:acylphosphatase